eukprot:TRINITY_DN14835_c0_g1_i1.p1 TRINITY_DN14835_c0_g1~~TRINITY_DN14835_c0_g1_i1.p1  ORF type:complete len:701 (+),score=139.88 TRINITY_DN14835_c0_g1_i1:279-2105(+)
MYDLDQLSMKFERHIDAEVLQFQFLSSDFTKMVFLQTDRRLEFHASFGKYHSLRIPKAGRDIAYHQQTCEVLACGTGSEVYRLNLERGCFVPPLSTSLPNINVCGIEPLHQLYMFGGDDGVVECWDSRAPKNVGTLNITQILNQHTDGEGYNTAITSQRFFGDGIRFGLGTSTGYCLLFDLRANRPFLIKDHQYGLPIHTLKYENDMIYSADKKILKIWDHHDGKVLAHIEPSNDVNDICVVKNTGMVLMALEKPEMEGYYMPSIGPAPFWCSYLDNLTEELEEKETSVYEDYRFVMKDELERLGLGNMVGTPFLKAYMHGYFMDAQLFKKVQSLADPDAYENYKKEKVKQKLEAQSSSRITSTTAKDRLNQLRLDMARRFAEDKMKKEAETDNNRIVSAEDVEETKEEINKILQDPLYSIDPKMKDRREMIHARMELEKLKKKQKKELSRKRKQMIEEIVAKQGRVLTEDQLQRVDEQILEDEFEQEKEDEEQISQLSKSNRPQQEDSRITVPFEKTRKTQPKKQKLEFYNYVEESQAKTPIKSFGERLKSMTTRDDASFHSGDLEVTAQFNAESSKHLPKRDQLVSDSRTSRKKPKQNTKISLEIN